MRRMLLACAALAVAALAINTPTMAAPMRINPGGNIKSMNMLVPAGTAAVAVGANGLVGFSPSALGDRPADGSVTAG